MTSEADQGVGRLFSEARLGPVTLRNRLIRTAAFEGMTQGGQVSDHLIEHHRRLAAGGIGMTTVAYCSVRPDGRTFAHQLVMSQDVRDDLARLVHAVHSEGAAASIQLGHAGLFADKRLAGGRPLGPSAGFNLYGMSLGRAMTEAEIHQLVDDFRRAAKMACQAGFDAVELHLGHGYLLSQFLSLHSNKRSDQWGGSLENRLRLPLAVVDAVLEEIGSRRAVLAKINMMDGFSGGLELDCALRVAMALEDHGVSGLVLSGGYVSKTPFFMLRGKVPVREMVSTQRGMVRKLGLTLFGRMLVQTYPYEPTFFLGPAQRMRSTVRLPLVYVGGVTSLDDMIRVTRAGFEFLALGRALIFDPDFPNKLRAGDIRKVDCDHCNRCVAAMEAGGIRCVTREEETASS